MSRPDSLWTFPVREPNTWCKVIRILFIIFLFVAGLVQFGNERGCGHLGGKLDVRRPVQYALRKVCKPLAGDVVAEDHKQRSGEP